MPVQTISNTYNNNTAVDLPSNSRNIRVDITAPRGGNGGTDGNPTEAAGTGGSGRVGSFILNTNFVARTLRLRVGGRGENGTDGFDSTEGIGGAGGAAGASAGGRGQNQRNTDISGGAGGGGGSSGVYDTFSDAWVAVAGGGGGGGGASDSRDGGDGSNGGGWDTGNVNPSDGDGFGNEFTSGDGGGGGGGGGGAPGGDRGTQGSDGNFGSTGGSGGQSKYNPSIATIVSGSNGTNFGNGSITLTYEVVTPVINSFTATPNPQTSGSDGIPNFNTSLSWSTTDAQTVTINQGIGSVSANGGTTVTNLPQSTAGSSSPATITYTLTACTGGICDTQNLTVSVFNDNTPNNYSIANRNNLEPNTFYVIDLGAITGIDMITNVIGGPGVTVSKNNLQNYVSSITIVNNNSVQLRFRSDPFNQDPSGQPTAPRSLYVDIGPVRRFFTISTRAPDVNETFNLSNENNRVPYPDIDTISEPSEPFIVSDTLLVDDIELQDPSGVEIKTSNSNIQIRKRIPGSLNWGPWQNVRSI
jgi:hypothetical protein